MNTKSSLARAVLLLAVLAAMGVLFGCGTDAVLEPGEAPPGVFQPQVTQSQVTPKETFEWTEVGSRTVYPGTETEVSGSRYALTFGLESLEQPTTITIKERDPGVVDVELGPHGTKFSDPVKFVIDYAGTANDPDSKDFHGYRPQLYWWNPDAKTWEGVPGINDKEAKTCTVYLEHFSHYAMRDGIVPETTKGGGRPHDSVSDDEQQWEDEQQW